MLALAFVMDMFVKASRGMLTAVLQSMPSPLEMCACIAVVDGSAAKHCFQIALAVTSLCLAVCDWHVPRVISYHNLICRFLSAISMQALFPYSPTLSCLAFLYPTFGKRAQSTPTSTPEPGDDGAAPSASGSGSTTEITLVLQSTSKPLR